MRPILITAITALSLISGPLAFSHPATERYIPISESPGVSKVKSYIGTIQAVRTTASGLTLSVADAEEPISVTEKTKIYLDTGPGKSNKTGTEEDCQVGRIVEVYRHDDGTVYWVKIKVR